jgi:hypothetical protein
MGGCSPTWAILLLTTTHFTILSGLKITLSRFHIVISALRNVYTPPRIPKRENNILSHLFARVQWVVAVPPGLF